MNPQVALLGKKEAVNVIGIKQVVYALNFLLVGRDKKDSKEERDNIIKEIEARQVAAEKGEAPPLMMCPEGATTNGKYLIQFKRGAFFSLRAVKPYFSSYWTLTNVRPVHGDSISFLAYMNVLYACGIVAVTYNEMPVFKPNEYFWKHHWDGKEDKWVAFARAVR